MRADKTLSDFDDTAAKFAQAAFQHMQCLPRSQTTCFVPGAANGNPGFGLPTAMIKSTAADFQVDELLPFVPEGKGQHLLLQVRKQQLNTIDLQRHFAQLAKCRQHDVGYSGLKDFRARTSQWFTLPAAGLLESGLIELSSSGESGVDISRLQAALDQHYKIRQGEASCLDAGLHPRKLRVGTHRANRFSLRLRDCALAAMDQTEKDQAEKEPGSESARQPNSVRSILVKEDPAIAAVSEACQTTFDARLRYIREQGFPNYFGSQRFGRNGSNLLSGYQWLGKDDAKRQSKGRIPQRFQFGVSALRSYVFNLVCGGRVSDGSWVTAGEGEPVMFADGHTHFINCGEDHTVSSRMESGELSTSGPLFGALSSKDEAMSGWLNREILGCRVELANLLAAESARSAALSDVEVGLVPRLAIAGLRHQRRQLRCKPANMTWRWSERSTEKAQQSGDSSTDSTLLHLDFELPPGSYATALLHELGVIEGC